MNSLKKIILSTACTILLFGTAQAQGTLKSETLKTKKGITNLLKDVGAASISLIGVYTLYLSSSYLEEMIKETYKESIEKFSVATTLGGTVGAGVGVLFTWCGVKHFWQTHINKTKNTNPTN